MGQLIHFQNATELIAAVNFMGEMALKSQFLKFPNVEAAKMLAMTALTRGVDLLDVCQTFDIIGGRLSKKSAAMLAELKARGGKYRILRRDSEAASVEFEFDGLKQTFSLTWEQIQNEDYTKEKDGKSYKPRYKEPHSRMQMLWARLISDSVRAIAPEVTGGYYTPEEMEDITDGECKTVAIMSPPVANIATTAPSSQSVEPQPAVAQPTVAGAAAATAELTTAAGSTAHAEVMISHEQMSELSVLFSALQISQATIDASLASRGCKTVADLTSAQAIEIIAKLRANLPSETGTTRLNTNGPMTQELESQIQDAIKVCAQVEGGLAITTAIQEHLAKYGVGLRQLTYAEGQALLSAVEQRQVKAFLDLALQGGQQVGKA